ncbi:FkbM family methyltransferase [Salinisphaera sp. SPP-AMP-43]|uniref:FkbM family methyltransferase n=1 Tax=Salinisphaera sp. SPP-AMP-43 TaxID=3121288 RepID=UPI003C6E4161
MSGPAWLGLARSLVIYHAQPWRTLALRRFYRQLIAPGSLVFDIGAHVGHRSQAMARAGAAVVAVEPQPLFAAWLARRLRGQRRIRLSRQALGAAQGSARLAVSSRHPTVSTLSRDWIETVGTAAGFAHVRWDHTVEVEISTLDVLIERYGTPAFCKIDVEGFEAAILAGLSQPLACIAFECLPAARDTALACIDRLAELADDYRYNWVVGERHRWANTHWLSPAACRAALQALPAAGCGLDVYARRTGWA